MFSEMISILGYCQDYKEQYFHEETLTYTQKDDNPFLIYVFLHTFRNNSLCKHITTKYMQEKKNQTVGYHYEKKLAGY